MSTNSEGVLLRLGQVFEEIFIDSDHVFSPGLTPEEIEEWDSLNQIRLLMAIEMEFGFKFDLDEMDSLVSVAAILESIEQKIS